MMQMHNLGDNHRYLIQMYSEQYLNNTGLHFKLSQTCNDKAVSFDVFLDLVAVALSWCTCSSPFSTYNLNDLLSNSKAFL